MKISQTVKPPETIAYFPDIPLGTIFKRAQGVVPYLFIKTSADRCLCLHGQGGNHVLGLYEAAPPSDVPIIAASEMYVTFPG
jgi:hypothetical protein